MPNNFDYFDRPLYGEPLYGRNAFSYFGVGGAVPSTPPVVSAMTPTPMTTVARNQVHSFDFTDDEEFTTIIIAVGYPSGRWDFVYNGTSFMPQYVGSTITPIANGFHLDVARVGGWAELGTLNMFVEGVDTTGAENV